jgi:hypothetical protein
MNRLKPQKQAEGIGALMDGNSVRCTELKTGTHRETISPLDGAGRGGYGEIFDQMM